MLQFIDQRTREYLYDHGASIDKAGMIHISLRRFEKQSYIHKSLRHPGKWAWMLPSMNGCCLIFEGMHFQIDG